MRMILMSTLFALGVGLAGMTGATAAPAADNFSKAANSTSIVQDAYCRVRRTCWWRHGHRFCDVRRRCW